MASSSTVARGTEVAHQVLPETAKAGRAKANLRIPEIDQRDDYKAAIGGAIQRAVSLVGWSNKEAAAKVGVDDSQFGKWISGAERPHMDRLFAIEALRWPLLRALGEMSGAAAADERLRRIA